MDLCEFGHSIMEAQATKLYTKKVDGKLVDRGVAFPICISVNDVVCNHSPSLTEETVRKNNIRFVDVLLVGIHPGFGLCFVGAVVCSACEHVYHQEGTSIDPSELSVLLPGLCMCDCTKEQLNRLFRSKRIPRLVTGSTQSTYTHTHTRIHYDDGGHDCSLLV